MVLMVDGGGADYGEDDDGGEFGNVELYYHHHIHHRIIIMIMIIVLTVLYRGYTVSCYNTPVFFYYTCNPGATDTASAVDSSYCTVRHNTIALLWSHL